MSMLTHRQLARDIEQFLRFKRALGYPYGRGEATLRSLQRFTRHVKRNTRARFDLAAAIKAWLVRIADRKPVTVATDLGAVRQLCLYRRRYDPAGFVPEHAWAPQTESTYAPHIFSLEQIHQLLDVAGQHRGRNIWAGMLRMLLLILYCTGLRFGEAIRLKLSDVDMDRCAFSIRESKGRSRLVPFGNDLAREIQHYLRERANIVSIAEQNKVDALFIGRDGRAVSIRTASDAVRRLLRKLGMKGAAGRTGPRPYDLRHTFAVHRLTEWYQRGVDIHARLPWLSAYMGHVNVLGTEVYLHATPELLRLASDRFNGRLHHARARR